MPNWQPTCQERQDAAIADLQISAGYAQAAENRLMRMVEDLAQRVAELEAHLVSVPKIGILDASKRIPPPPVMDSRTATPNQTYSWLPGDAWSQYCQAEDQTP